jgi:aryl-alcohol dehydrogenase-like predicted oxidoreductase
MKYRTFGRNEWQVSEIGYGMWGMAGWTGSDDDESMKSMQLAVDLGCNFFDTAWGWEE